MGIERQKRFSSEASNFVASKMTQVVIHPTNELERCKLIVQEKQREKESKRASRILRNLAFTLQQKRKGNESDLKERRAELEKKMSSKKQNIMLELQCVEKDDQKNKTEEDRQKKEQFSTEEKLVL